MEIVLERAAQAVLMLESETCASMTDWTRGSWDGRHQELRLFHDWNLLSFLAFLTSHSHQDCFVSMATFK